MKNQYRIEKDSVGELSIPIDAYWGIHSFRASENFRVSERKVQKELIKSYCEVKKACAIANFKSGYLDEHIHQAIVNVCNEFDENDFFTSIIVDAYQGGAGTSTNLNVNEVIANYALEKLGHKKGEYQFCDPFEHVNLHQSTNDTYPTALRIAVYRLLQDLETAIVLLQEKMQKKEGDFSEIVKMSRTELMDAVPMTLGRTFGAWADVLSRDRWRIFKCTERIRVHNLGGTAIGTGIGAPRDYIFKISQVLKEVTGLPFSRAENMVEATQNQDALLEVMGMVKTHAMNLLKISNDLRILAMGPDCGIHELRLPALQTGSTIMPEKINPVIPEMVSQVAMQVSAMDQAVTWALGSGQLELNAFLPLVAHNMIEALKLLTAANRLLAEKCIDGIVANADVCQARAMQSRALVTVLVPVIGYHQASQVAKKMKEESMDFLEAAQFVTGMERSVLESMITPEAVNAIGFEKRREEPNA